MSDRHSRREKKSFLERKRGEAKVPKKGGKAGIFAFGTGGRGEGGGAASLEKCGVAVYGRAQFSLRKKKRGKREEPLMPARGGSASCRMEKPSCFRP